MSYDFEFDLVNISRSFFWEITEGLSKAEIKNNKGELAKEVIENFNLQGGDEKQEKKMVELIKHMIAIHSRNLEQEEDFKQSENRALLLPHCSRKHMDDRCDSSFDARYSTYECGGCSEDCLINKADQLGKEEGYDTFVLPGGSCIPKIIEKNNYDGIVAVACPNEVHMCTEALDEENISHQGISLLKNGCSNTVFNLETLQKILRK